ncbi:hypothetical protein AX16_011008 [Volvariella volvacea WC 439]|nr:hypothetical protein AX16_011008 [Volvariella volvacea WC 439]
MSSSKRPASGSPLNSRATKRPATSSPEEGELDDPLPPMEAPHPPQSQAHSSLPPPSTSSQSALPASLPAKPVTSMKSKVPFPFKKKADATATNGFAGSSSHSIEGSAPAAHDHNEEEDRRMRDSRKGAGRSSRPILDHWEPSQGRERHTGTKRRFSEWGELPLERDRDRDRERERERGRLSPPPRYSPNRSHSNSPYREKHRLPAPRSPEPAFSPPRRPYPPDRGKDSWTPWDSRDRRYRDDDGDRHYRPDTHNDYRRIGDSWSRRDDYDSDRRYRPDDYDRQRRHDSYRPVSPAFPPARSATPRASTTPSSARMLPSTFGSQPQPSERSQLSEREAPPSVPASPPGRVPSAPGSASISEPGLDQHPPEPPVPAPPRPESSMDGKTPPPPACSPPPAPPPDPRLSKSSTSIPLRPHEPLHIHPKPFQPQPQIHPLPLSRPQPPPAPKDAHSPPSMSLPVAPPQESSSMKTSTQVESSKLKVGRKREPTKRTPKEEVQAYGRTFAGCGQQSDYEVMTKLGEGTFGEVHKAIHKNNGTVVALKRILMHNEKEGMPVTALREIKILKALKHPCIVELLDMFVVRSNGKDPLSVYMVFPYMDHDLAGLLENERVKLQPSHIKLYMKQLLEGTEYMHRNNILHRDMKAANLLISNSGRLRIADFGLARAFDPYVVRGGAYDHHRGREKKYTNCVVTRWYRPPELLLGARQYGGEIDIWGIGCVLGEMFMRRPILPGNSDLDQLEKIWQLCGTPNQHTWPNFDALPGCRGTKFTSFPRRVKQVYESVGTETADLLDKLLICNPRERITAAEALDHEYFWTDPLPADPKTLPSYEPSHEFDKRGHRNQHPPPQLPPPTVPQDPHYPPPPPAGPHPHNYPHPHHRPPPPPGHHGPPPGPLPPGGYFNPHHHRNHPPAPPMPVPPPNQPVALAPMRFDPQNMRMNPVGPPPLPPTQPPGFPPHGGMPGYPNGPGGPMGHPHAHPGSGRGPPRAPGRNNNIHSGGQGGLPRPSHLPMRPPVPLGTRPGGGNTGGAGGRRPPPPPPPPPPQSGSGGLNYG